MAIDTLDLHGVPHAQVEAKVENFVLLSVLPCRIITGNSPGMQSLVNNILKRHQLTSCYENDYNLGALIVIEN